MGDDLLGPRVEHALAEAPDAAGVQARAAGEPGVEDLGPQVLAPAVGALAAQQPAAVALVADLGRREPGVAADALEPGSYNFV